MLTGHAACLHTWEGSLLSRGMRIAEAWQKCATSWCTATSERTTALQLGSGQRRLSTLGPLPTALCTYPAQQSLQKWCRQRAAHMLVTSYASKQIWQVCCACKWHRRTSAMQQ